MTTRDNPHAARARAHLAADVSERVELTDGERAVMLAPCECGHDLDDHGGLAGCWACADDVPPRECRVTFEALLIERQERIIAERVAEALANHTAVSNGVTAESDQQCGEGQAADRRTANVCITDCVKHEEVGEV